jgi:hypothetical protein
MKDGRHTVCGKRKIRTKIILDELFDLALFKKLRELESGQSSLGLYSCGRD